jgi:hypothetical protein
VSDAPAWTLDACFCAGLGNDCKSWPSGLTDVPCWGYARRGTRRLALRQWLVCEVVRWDTAVNRSRYAREYRQHKATPLVRPRHSTGSGKDFKSSSSRYNAWTITSDVTFAPSTLKEQAALYTPSTGCALSHDLAHRRMIRTQRADRYVYCSSSNYRLQ